MIDKIVIECKKCGGCGKVSITVPESLKKARVAAGISLRTFAKRIGFTAPYISDIENGRRACTNEIEEYYSLLNSEVKKWSRK